MSEMLYASNSPFYQGFGLISQQGSEQAPGLEHFENYYLEKNRQACYLMPISGRASQAVYSNISFCIF